MHASLKQDSCGFLLGMASASRVVPGATRFPIGYCPAGSGGCSAPLLQRLLPLQCVRCRRPPPLSAAAANVASAARCCNSLP